MTLFSIPSFLSGLLCVGLSVIVFFRNPRSLVHRTFVLGMIFLSVREFGSAMALLFLQSTIVWTKISLVGEAFLPGTWLLFSLSFARSNYKDLIQKWEIFIYSLFGIPLLLLIIGWSNLLKGSVTPLREYPEEIMLGGSGFFLKLLLLFSFVLILTNLEATYRASTGIKRWQIKLMILGLGGLFAFGIFDLVQTILYSSIKRDDLLVRSIALILANSVIFFALIRHRLLDVDFFVSRYVIYNSLTLLISGIYLFLVGLFIFGIQELGGEILAPYIPVVVFVFLLILIFFLLSEQVRWKIRSFIITNFYKNKHDYRIIWREFTNSVGSKLTMSDLSASIVSWLPDTLGSNGSALWSYDPSRKRLVFEGQNNFSLSMGSWPETGKLLLLLHEDPRPFLMEIVEKDKKWEAAIQEIRLIFDERWPAVFIPLFTGMELLGLIALGEKIGRNPYDFHDLELLKTVADQIAGQIHRVKITEELARARELEAFQTLSAFFIHDLKNLASKLSLVVQNIPLNYDNPVFREDSLRVISESVGKMNLMCSNLSMITKKLALKNVKTDLNHLVDSTLNELGQGIQVPLLKNYQLLPLLSIDQEEFQKVLINIILNASEAIRENGEISITTSQKDGWVQLEVRDNGCGMTAEYVSKSLFLPFQTTKSKGLGIGLFQCKKIVEAYRGRIEVESEVGKGSLFRILLPVKDDKA